MSFNPYSYDEVADASKRLYEALCVATLLKDVADDGHYVKHMDMGDLGGLFVRLVDPPLTIINELLSEMEPGAHDPDPGQHKPELVSISKKQDAGGAK